MTSQLPTVVHKSAKAMSNLEVDTPESQADRSMKHGLRCNPCAAARLSLEFTGSILCISVSLNQDVQELPHDPNYALI